MKSTENITRRKSDYLVMFAIFGLIYYIAETHFPERSSPQDLQVFRSLFDPLGLEARYGPFAKWGFWYLITVLTMNTITWTIFLILRKIDPQKTPLTHFKLQSKTVLLNFLQLPLAQVCFDILQQQGFTKANILNLSPFQIFRDTCLWMLCFQWAWYVQHRAMHDIPFLWKLGHSFHHTWRLPEHMIGITNFAFDHIVQFWVTMSSSFLGYLLFPSNFYVGKGISLMYMILAVLAHWQGFGYRYHINHHYLVVKNYGSHVPIFDWLLGTLDLQHKRIKD